MACEYHAQYGTHLWNESTRTGCCKEVCAVRDDGAGAVHRDALMDLMNRAHNSLEGLTQRLCLEHRPGEDIFRRLARIEDHLFAYCWPLRASVLCRLNLPIRNDETLADTFERIRVALEAPLPPAPQPAPAPAAAPAARTRTRVLDVGES